MENRIEIKINFLKIYLVPGTVLATIYTHPYVIIYNL